MEVVDLAQESSWQNQMKGEANWFYWIAGLSFINAAILYFGINWNFFLGMGITHVVNGELNRSDSSGILALVVNTLIAAVVAAFGYFANRGQIWAFAVGFILYFLDTFLLLYSRDFLGIVFHAIALYFLFRGLLFCRRVQLEAALDRN